MESYLRRGYIEFLTLSPVFIGSGKELNKKVTEILEASTW